VPVICPFSVYADYDHETFHPVMQSRLAFGGNPKANATDHADSWPRVIEFLQTNLVLL